MLRVKTESGSPASPAHLRSTGVQTDLDLWSLPLLTWTRNPNLSLNPQLVAVVENGQTVPSLAHHLLRQTFLLLLVRCVSPMTTCSFIRMFNVHCRLVPRVTPNWFPNGIHAHLPYQRTDQEMLKKLLVLCVQYRMPIPC